jgi:hypothetical protein
VTWFSVEVMHFAAASASSTWLDALLIPMLIPPSGGFDGWPATVYG